MMLLHGQRLRTMILYEIGGDKANTTSVTQQRGAHHYVYGVPLWPMDFELLDRRPN